LKADTSKYITIIDPKEKLLTGLENSGILSNGPKWLEATSPTKKSQDRYAGRNPISSHAWRLRGKKFDRKKVRSDWKNMPATKQKGFVNPNVLCYRNSLCQALLHTPQMVDFLKEHHKPEDCESILCPRVHLC
jgi:hypothetical protein